VEFMPGDPFLEEVGMPASTTIAKLSAGALRRLADKADGLRDKHPLLVVDSKDEVDVVIEADLRADQHPLIDLETPNDGPGLCFKPTIRLIVNGTEFGEGTQLDQADAVFTSQSAVEKFLLPYYMRVRTPAQVAEIARAMFDDEFTVCGHHLPGSTWGRERSEPTIETVRFNPAEKKLEFIHVSTA
jgi:hypothetical protein